MTTTFVGHGLAKKLFLNDGIKAGITVLSIGEER
jgi:hypothetical protein